MSIPKGAALGSSDDPRALVVGDPGSLDAAATTLETQATVIADVGTDLGRVKAPTWSGIASLGFWASFAPEVQTWAGFSEIMTKSATALRDQAGALRTAQDKAQQAIDLWNEAEEASRKARETYNSAVDDHNTRIEAGQLSFAPGPFHDPGEAMREEAQQVLDDAATALDEAGLDNAGTLAGLAGLSWNDGSVDVSGPGTTGEVKGPKLSYGNDKALYDKRAPWNSQYKDGDHALSPQAQIASASAAAYLYRTKAETEGNYHGLDYKAGAEFRVGAEAGASAALSKEGLKLGANAGFGATAKAEASGEYGIASGQANLEAFAGGRADVDASIGKDGVHARGEAFVGGKIGGDVGGDIGGVGGELRGEAWAGAGIGGDLDVGFENGEITIGGDVGAGLGVGGKIGGSFTIDPVEVVGTVGDMASGVGDFLGF